MAKKEKQENQAQPEQPKQEEITTSVTTAAIATTQPTALQHGDPGALSGVEGLGGLDSSDLTIPRKRILQPTSDEAASGEGKPGTIVCNLTGQVHDELRIIPLFFKKSRSKFEKGTKKPSCASDDGLVPASRIADPLCDRCAVVEKGRMVEVCPFAKWANDEPPACQMSYNLFCLEAETEMPCIVTLKGKSIKPVKRLISYYALRRVSPFDVQVILGTEMETNSKGTYYVATFGGFEPIEPRGKYRDTFLALQSYDIGRTFEAEEEVAGGSPPSDDAEPELPPAAPGDPF